jgi:diaminopimelate decarboxylase
MNTFALPCTRAALEAICERHPTPFHLYDERGIRGSLRRLRDAFAWEPGFTEFFAVKATPNPYILKLLQSEGAGADCSSLPELLLAEHAGIVGEQIVFTSNDTPAEDFVAARRLGAVINLDDITHLPFLQEAAGLPDLISFRYNPGPSRTGNTIIGSPEEAKYGLTRAQLDDAYRQARDAGVRRFGLHTMVASNELQADYFVETARMLFEIVVELRDDLGIDIEQVNIGGGMGIAYRPDDSPVDVGYVGAAVQRLYNEMELAPLRLCSEMGRYITGPHGYLVAHVRHIKDTYRQYAGLDASMANLMRPGMYGAYHHISVVGKEDQPLDHTYDVTGSLCENNDKFAIGRPLPELVRGDVVVIHCAGAHGHSMGFNYNGKLRSAELLLREDSSVVEIRRAETVADHFATLDFDGLADFAAVGGAIDHAGAVR